MLTKWLIHYFEQKWKNHNETKIRYSLGLASGAVGIAVNLILFGVKLGIGLFAHSIATIADAFNNLSDVGSSSVTIYGFKMAKKPADPEHPFGHGRVEYLAGFIVSLLVLVVGVESLKSSIKRIVSPKPIVFSWLTIGLLIFSIFMKLWMSSFNYRMGRHIQSDALKAASADALMDVLSTSAVLISFVMSRFTDIPLDGYIGLAISLFILYNAYRLIRDTIQPLLGTAPDEELVQAIKDKLLSYPHIEGVHDLYVHNYGPGNMMASIHVEVPANISIVDMHDIIDQAEKACQNELGIQLVIHCDPIITNDETVLKARDDLESILQDFPSVQSFHDFRVVQEGEKKTLVFDLVVNHKAYRGPEDDEYLKQTINRRLQAIDPDYRASMIIEKDFLGIHIATEEGTKR